MYELLGSVEVSFEGKVLKVEHYFYLEIRRL
jgi:hypothetical protein